MATAGELEARTAVARVIAALSGDVPLAGVEACLDRDVIIHVDGSETHRGIGLWKRWVHLMRERGRLDDLRFEPDTMAITDGVIDVTFRWSGVPRRGRDAGQPRTLNHVRYRVEDDRIVEIWTRKANYVDVFGGFIRFTPLYRLFLLWGLVYFLVRRHPEFRLDR